MSLDVSGCRLTDEAALPIVSAACNCESGSLHTLKLQDNLISDGAGQAMLRMLTPQPTLLGSSAGGAVGGSADGSRSPRVQAWGGGPGASTPRGGARRSVPTNAFELVAQQRQDRRDAADVDAQLSTRRRPETATKTHVHNISMHGNQLSYATLGGLRDQCAANKEAVAVEPSLTSRVLELSSSIPALHMIEHQLKGERQAAEAAEAELAGLERELRELEERATSESAELATECEEAEALATEADQQYQAIHTKLTDEEAVYEAQREHLDAEITALVGRKGQLLDLGDKSPKRKSVAPRKASEELQSQLPPLDATLTALRAEQDLRSEQVEEQALREKRAIALRLWAESALSILDQVERAHRAKQKAKVAQAAPKKAPKR